MIKPSVVTDVLAKALSTGGDFAEIFLENTDTNTIVLIDGKVDQISSGRVHGAGIRIFSGFRGIYAYTNDTSRTGLLAAAEKAAGVIMETMLPQSADIHLEERIFENHYPIVQVPASVHGTKKIALLKAMHHSAKNRSHEIVQVMGRWLDSDQKILIANSEGLFTEDRRVRTRFIGQAIASNGSENQVGYEAPGRHMGMEMFSELIDVECLGRDIADTAITMLHAPYSPAGTMPVAIENEFGGVIFHEACGHSLEATSVAKGTSEFSGKLGQKIAADCVTAVDDGTIPYGWGSQNIDDEGIPTQRTILIENGILKGYLIDRLNARRMNMSLTGSGRRESYQYAPTSRMSNTYIAKGNDSREAIINSIERGIYAKKMGGGSVDPATGEFNFAVLEGYLIENGEIRHPVRGASLIGKGSDILMKIDMVGQNLEFGTGMCGSESGSVPAFVGQPLIRVSSMIVGGK